MTWIFLAMAVVSGIFGSMEAFWAMVILAAIYTRKEG